MAKRETEDELLTVRQVAPLLGTSEAVVYAHVSRKILPGVVRIGRSVRFSKKALLKWIAEGGTQEATS